jgi:hypothetical protein
MMRAAVDTLREVADRHGARGGLWAAPPGGDGASLLDGARVYDAVPDNAYRTATVVAPETAPGVYALPGVFGATKYDPILLKEWFYALQVKGTAVIAVPDRVAAAALDARVRAFFPKGALAVKEVVDTRAGAVVVVQKDVPALPARDAVSRWTFGVVTNGRRDAVVDAMIGTIRRQRIPEYEVIVCGTSAHRSAPDIRYIPFSEQDDRGWITRKKNLIAEAARFENLAIVHDRVLFRAGWYRGMRRFGNHFDALSCVQRMRAGFRTWDWVTSSAPLGAPAYGCVGLDYRDWDPYVFMDGGLTIVKRRVWEQCPWDERRFWNDREDVDISHRITAAGGVIRFNRHSRCRTLFWRHNVIPVARVDPVRLGAARRRDLPSALHARLARSRWRRLFE